MIGFKLPFTETENGGAAGDSLAPLLARDVALMFGQIGVVSLRASVVDMESMAFQSTWGITEHGEVDQEAQGRGLDSTFPAAMATIAQMGAEPQEETVVRKLSPRHWAFAWRIDGRLVAVAEARYHDPRDMMSPADTALVRLLCDTGIRAGQGDTGRRRRSSSQAAGAGDQLHLAWPGTEGRRAWQPLQGTWLALLLVAASALLALWMAAFLAPRARDEVLAQQTEVTRLRDMGSRSMLNSLAAVLATGDYGEVQAALSGFEALGYFRGAVVTNARLRVVAMAGSVPEARIGDGLPASLARAAESAELTLGNQRHGQLLTLDGPPRVVQASSPRLMAVGATTVCALSTAGALLLVLRLRARR